jgi:hypothetical protein
MPDRHCISPTSIASTPAPVISTIVMSSSFATSAHATSAYFTNSLTPPTSLVPTSVVLAAGPFSVGQRAARSLPERWPALPFVGAALRIYGFKAINARTRGSWSPPFKSVAEMDAKARDLALLAASRSFAQWYAAISLQPSGER